MARGMARSSCKKSSPLHVGRNCDAILRGYLATPYDGRLEPDPKEYVWE